MKISTAVPMLDCEPGIIGRLTSLFNRSGLNGRGTIKLELVADC